MGTVKAIRLDKYLSEMNVESRTNIKQMVKKGLIQIDGAEVKKPDIKVIPDVNRVTIDGVDIQYKEVEYYMLNKPAGVITATEDARMETVMDLLPKIRRTDLSPVGRLDKDTEGLLLITNDGQLAHRLLSPKHHAEKTYYAKIDGLVTKEDCMLFSDGLDIGDEKKTLPAKLFILGERDEFYLPGETNEAESQILVTLTEGRYHQVKRMFEAVGKRVLYLKRLSMGGLSLDESLKPGDYRELTEKEVEEL